MTNKENFETGRENSNLVDKELERQLTDLLKSAYFESKDWQLKLTDRLNDWVSELLSNPDVVKWIKDFCKKYPEHSDLLKSVFDLMSQKENVEQSRLDELKKAIDESKNEIASLSSSEWMAFTGEVLSLIEWKKYQEALDKVVAKFESNPTPDEKLQYFGIVANIINRMPRWTTLSINGNEVNYSDRDKWINKMKQNSLSAQREKVNWYQDRTLLATGTDAYWSLNTIDSWKKLKEKKATRKFEKELTWDKELSKIVDKLNPASAVLVIDQHYEELSQQAWKKDITEVLTKEILIQWGYLPKNWKEISNKELRAVQWLFLYRWYHTQVVETWKDPQTWEQVDKDYSAKKLRVLDTISNTKVSWLTMSERRQADNILNWIENHQQLDPQNTMMVLLWDYNWDGDVIIDSVKTDYKVDQWTVSWGQVSRMYENAIIRFGEEHVAQKIEEVVSWLATFSGFKIEPKTQQWIVDAFVKNPNALLAFRKKLLSEPDFWMNMLYYGKNYWSRRIEELKANEEIIKNAEASAKDALERYPDVKEELEWKLIDQQKRDIATARANLDELIKSWKLDDEETQALIKQREALSDENIQNMLNSQEMKDLRKSVMISWLTAVFSATDFEWDKQYGVGLAWNLTSEKLNDAIAKSKVFNNLSAPVGIYKAIDWKFSLGVWLTLSWNQELSKNTTLFYSVGVSGQVLEPQWIWTSAAVGIDWQTNNPGNRLWDAKAAQHIGLVSSYWYGFSLTDSNFNVQWINIQAYWRKDKLEWVEQQAEAIKDSMKTVLAEIFKNGVTIDSIVTQLQSTFEDTKWEDLYNIAVGILNTYNSYKEHIVKKSDDWENELKVSEEVLNALSWDLAKYMAQNSRNQNIERIVREWLHLSQVWVWVSFTLSSLLKGFFLSWSVVFTKYDKEHYVENKQAIKDAIEWLNRQEFFDTINTKSLAEKITTINRLLGQEGVLKYNEKNGEQPAFISIDTAVFKPWMTVFCNPKLAPYIHYSEDWKLMLPFNADISLGKILHQWKEDHALILWSISAAWCKEVQLWEDNKLKWKDWDWEDFNNQDKEYGLDKYNVTTEIVPSVAEIQLDWRANEKLIDELAKNWDLLVNFRQRKKEYNPFINFIKTHPDRKDPFVEDAVALLPDSIKWILDKWTADDIRFVYASLSRVSQTRDKQLEWNELRDKANEYLEQCHLNKDNKNKIIEYIDKVVGGASLDEEKWWEWETMKNILWIKWNDWYRAFADTPNEKLFHILTPVRKLADMRTNSYNYRIENEYKTAWAPEWAKALKAAREKALNQLNGRTTATAVDDNWNTIFHKWIWAVAWYDLRNQIDDKFVSWPKIITVKDSVRIEDPKNDVARHFLEELAVSDISQFNKIGESIIENLNKWGVKDKELATELEKHMWNDPKEFIRLILEAKSVDKDWKETKEPKINIEMNYWFFAECVNETILLESIKVNILKTEQKYATNDVYYYDAVVTNDAVTRARNFGLTGMYGELKRKEEPNNSSETTPLPKEWGKTKPEPDYDLSWDNIVSVDWVPSVEFNWEYYPIMTVTDIPEIWKGNVIVVGGDVYLLMKNGDLHWYQQLNPTTWAPIWGWIDSITNTTWGTWNWGVLNWSVDVNGGTWGVKVEWWETASKVTSRDMENHVKHLSWIQVQALHATTNTKK